MASPPNNTTKQLDKLLATAQRHSEKGRIDKAVTAYRELAQLEPNKIKHWLTIGYLEGKRGNLEEAAAIYRQVGNHYDSHGKTAKAIAVFRQVLAPCPTDTAVHLKLAELQLKENRPNESWQHYRRALALLLKDERLADAVLVLVAMTELAPDNVALWIRLAETAVSAGSHDRGVSAFTKAMDLLRSNDRTEEYLRVAERLSALTPDNLHQVRELGALYLEHGDVASALAKLHRCINANPQDEITLNLLVDAFLRIGDPDKAVNALRLLADLHLSRGEVEQHAEVSQRLLTLDSSVAPGTKPAHRKAMEDLASEPAVPIVDRRPSQDRPAPKAPDAPPDHADIVSTLLKEAAGYTKIGLFDGAADALHQARVLDPTNEKVFERLRTAYLKVAAVDDAVALIVEHAEGLAQSEPDRASALLDEAQELNADHPAVFRARMGPLDPHDLDSGAAEAASKSARRTPVEPRWANEGSSVRLHSDITAVTVKRPLPPDVTVKINVDELEQKLLEEQRLREHGPQTPLTRDAETGVYDELELELNAQPSNPYVFQNLTTGEIDLTELRDVLGSDAATENDATPSQNEPLANFKPDSTSPNALALSQRWRHLDSQRDDD